MGQEVKLRAEGATGLPVTLRDGSDWLVAGAVYRIDPRLRTDDTGRVVSDAVSEIADGGQIGELMGKAEAEGGYMAWPDLFVLAYLVLRKNYPELTTDAANDLLGPDEAAAVVRAYEDGKKNEPARTTNAHS